MQYGVGPELSAQCQTAPAPSGWRPWTDADGPLPEALEKRAQAVVADGSVALGSTESYPLPGVAVLIRIEPHIWARNDQGDLVQGCFRAAGLYLPSITPQMGSLVPPTEPDKLSKTIGVLTVVSLSVGIGATIFSWRRK